MTIQEFNQLYIWAKGAGITTIEELERFIRLRTDGTENDIFNKIHTKFIYQI